MVANGTLGNFDISKFVYPVPASEVNAGFEFANNRMDAKPSQIRSIYI